MKRKLLSVILAASMVAACLAGCGSDAGTQETAPAESEAPAEETGEEAEASGTESSGAKKLVFWDKAEYVDEYGSMMKAVVDVTKPLNIATSVSLNPIMIDGTGMCGCCRVSVDGKVRFACVDGPDFDGLQVDFDELMRRQRMFKHEEKETVCHMSMIRGED